ncbi:bifunctional heptose 7-phosphate kinase/heptose 1-phosphate adenyltransferase [Bacillota bacterium Meth-B3]
MDRARLLSLFRRFRDLRIAVAGDLFLDRWYEIDERLDEPSVETGLTAWQVVRKRAAAGAAGTVVGNLSEMGVGHLSVVSLVGEDGDGWEMLELLKRRGVDVGQVLVSDRVVTPSYIKPLFPREGNRLDIKNFRPTPPDLEDLLIERLDGALGRADALVLLEQVTEPDTGVLTARVREALPALARKYPDKLIFADSRAFIHLYRDVVIKCNNFEAARMTGRISDPDAFDARQVFESMDELAARTLKPVVVSCNAHGVAVMQDGERLLVPAVRQIGEIDVCGAGDACSAGIVSALCAGGSYAEAAFVGNLSAGVTVRQIGRTGTASQAAMLALYDEQFGGD